MEKEAIQKLKFVMENAGQRSLEEWEHGDINIAIREAAKLQGLLAASEILHVLPEGKERDSFHDYFVQKYLAPVYAHFGW